MGNIKKLYLSSIVWNLILMVAGGSILQTVLLETGLSEERTNQFFAIMQVVQVGTIILSASYADKVKNLIKTYAHCHWLTIPLILSLILLCTFRLTIRPAVYVGLLATGIFFNIAVGLANIFSYKVPYLIMDMNQYGKVHRPKRGSDRCILLFGIHAVILTANKVFLHPLDAGNLLDFPCPPAHIHFLVTFL